jgi:hypothetical protein
VSPNSRHSVIACPRAARRHMKGRRHAGITADSEVADEARAGVVVTVILGRRKPPALPGDQQLTSCAENHKCEKSASVICVLDARPRTANCCLRHGDPITGKESKAGHGDGSVKRRAWSNRVRHAIERDSIVPPKLALRRCSVWNKTDHLNLFRGYDAHEREPDDTDVENS